MRALVVAVAMLLVAAAVHAAEWDTVRPGESSQETIREHFGQPTKVSSEKVEGYDSAKWVYEGAQAPGGIVRLTFDFGILTPQGYRAELVRVMRLEPKPGVFTRNTVVAGWGMPQRAGREKDVEIFFYESGLLVFFDKEGWVAQTMVFTPPQPHVEGGAQTPR
jgi:hypothetical protein